MRIVLGKSVFHCYVHDREPAIDANLIHEDDGHRKDYSQDFLRPGDRLKRICNICFGVKPYLINIIKCKPVIIWIILCCKPELKSSWPSEIS